MDEKKAYWFEQSYMPRMKNIAVAPFILEDGRLSFCVPGDGELSQNKERGCKLYCYSMYLSGRYSAKVFRTIFYTFCGRYYAKINQVMPESKKLQRLTKPEKPRKTKKCEVMQQ